MATKRYFNNRWATSHLIHTFLGTYLLLITVVVCAYQLWLLRFVVKRVTLHTIAVVTLVLSVICTYGVALYSWRSPSNKKWHWHRIAGRIIICVGLVASFSGLYNYQRRVSSKENQSLTWLVATLSLTFIVFCELISTHKNRTRFRGLVRLRQTTNQSGPGYRFGPYSLLFKNQVLDVRRFSDFHPGGSLLPRDQTDITQFMFGSGGQRKHSL
jgi:hypothetical protein